MSRLQGKTALIVGATRAGNMGQSIARRFLDEGASGRARGVEDVANAALFMASDECF